MGKRIDYVKEVLVGMAWGAGFVLFSEIFAWVKSLMTGKPQAAAVLIRV